MSQPFLFALLVLSAFIVTYVITESAWPPAEWFRDKVGIRTGLDSGWYTLVGCSWCASAYVAAGFVVAMDRWFSPLPLPVLWWLGTWAAAAGIAAVTSD